MKKITFILILLSSASILFAQENKSDPWDLYAVVDTDSVAPAVLWDNAKGFLQNQEGCTLVSEDSLMNVKGTCGFWAYKSKVLKSIDGRIFFNVLIETKENRYRYFINDFHFMPYNRNRFGRYEADKGKTQLLSEADQSRKKAWKGYQEEANLFASNLAKKLEENMKTQPTSQKLEKVKEEKDW